MTCVQIIHGKGLHSARDQITLGVLVKHRLTLLNAVLAYATPAECYGRRWCCVYFTQEKSMHVKNILITGCSSGIGYETAKLCHTLENWNVLASCRNMESVRKLLAEKIPCVQLDLDDSDSIQAGFRHTMDHFKGTLDVLVNNAAYAEAGALEDLSRAQLRQQFESNVFGLMELTQYAIRVMRQQKSGTILNIGSILGHVAGPYKGAYNASKFALEGLTDTLRLELRQTKIKVIILDPGPVTTHFRRNAHRIFKKNIANKLEVEHSAHADHYRKYLAKNTASQKLPFALSSQSVAKKIHRILESKQPKARYFITLPAHVLIWAKQLLPTKLLDYLLHQSA